MEYQVKIDLIIDDDKELYFFAYLPQFGRSACSATGETAIGALTNLGYVFGDIKQLYADKGAPMPPILAHEDELYHSSPEGSCVPTHVITH